jgi:hypothetical protein
MKPWLIKILILVPLVLFADRILMILVGCGASLCGAGSRLYCSIFCFFGIFILSISAVLLISLFILKKKVDLVLNEHMIVS